MDHTLDSSTQEPISTGQIGQALNTWFNPEVCEALARETGFVQRDSALLKGNDFFNLVTIAPLNEPCISYEGLCDTLNEYNPDIQITSQALCSRMNSQGAVDFLKQGLEKTLIEATAQPKSSVENALLAPFPRVLLQDSTQIELNEELADHFKGSGGCASSSAVKIDYSYDVKNETVEQITIRQGAESDQGFANDLAARVKKDDLVIRDLGYLNLDFFAYLVAIGAYFLSRLGFNVNVYLTTDPDEKPINLIKHINQFGGNQNTLEFNVFLGKTHRIPMRLIVYRLPKSIYRERQKAAIKTAKRKGRRASLSYLKFLKFSFFITNVPANIWAADIVGTIYRLRWQVELTFKNWKSLFQINILKGTRPERIRCLIYGRLIVILTVQRLLAFASAQAISEQRELSFVKATQWILRAGRLVKAFLSRNFEKLIAQMLSCTKRLLKQKRKRLTTWDIIVKQIPYMDSFPDSENHDAGMLQTAAS